MQFVLSLCDFHFLLFMFACLLAGRHYKITTIVVSVLFGSLALAGVVGVIVR